MVTIPKMKPCPNCGTDCNMAIIAYDSGWTHVECTKCNYLGPGEGTFLAAVISHNENSNSRETS
jgi:Zn ribbon nucleic-acid-binding protein